MRAYPLVKERETKKVRGREMVRILIVEDDVVHAREIERALDDIGIRHLHARCAEEAIRLARQHRINIYVIDIDLPGVSGFTFAQVVRDHTNAPVIFMGDIDNEAQKAIGFEIGGDDFLVKPFGMLELSCRIRAILRRCEIKRYSASNAFKLNRDDHTVEIDGRKIRLTKLEFDLMFQLVMANGATVSKQTLIREVWGGDSMATNEVLKARMHSLKSKVGVDRIKAVYGDGYRIITKSSPVV